jgi:hypothetical protein
LVCHGDGLFPEYRAVDHGLAFFEAGVGKVPLGVVVGHDFQWFGGGRTLVGVFGRLPLRYTAELGWMVLDDFTGVELRRAAPGAAPMAEKVGAAISSRKPFGELRMEGSNFDGPVE